MTFFLFVLIYCVLTSVDDCPDNWTPLDLGDECVCFFYYGKPFTQQEALDYCRDSGGVEAGLAFANTQTKLDILVNMCGNCHDCNCWLGGTSEGWEDFEGDGEMIAYDPESAVVKYYWIDPALATGGIPTGNHSVLYSSNWELGFEEGSAKYQALCQVSIDATTDAKKPNSPFPLELFIAFCAAFSICLVVSHYRHRTSVSTAAKITKKRRDDLQLEAKRKKQSRTPI